MLLQQRLVNGRTPGESLFAWQQKKGQGKVI